MTWTRFVMWRSVFFALALLVLAVNVWYFGFHRNATHDWRKLYPREYQLVHALQHKAQRGEPLDDREVGQLIDLSKHGHALIESRALSAMAMLPAKHHPRAIDAMSAALSSPNEVTLVYAASGLAKLQARNKVDLIRPHLEHPDPLVRVKIEKSLQQLEHDSED